MVLVLPAGTNSFPSLVQRRVQTTVLQVGPYHRLVPPTHLDPPHSRIRGLNQETIHLPQTRQRRIAIVVTWKPRTGRTVADFLAWLGAFCIHSEVATKPLVQNLLVPTQGPTPCLEAGNPIPALAQSLEIGRLRRGVLSIAPWVEHIPALDRDAPRQLPSMTDRMHRSARVPTAVILAGIPLASGTPKTPEAIDGAVMIARGKGAGIETTREGTPTPGITRTSIERGVEVPFPYVASYLNMHLPAFHMLPCQRPYASTLDATTNLRPKSPVSCIGTQYFAQWCSPTRYV
jgi:hypothetical protein